MKERKEKKKASRRRRGGEEEGRKTVGKVKEGKRGKVPYECLRRKRKEGRGDTM